MPLEKFDGTVEILDAVVEILIGGAAEFGQIAGTRDPVMAARIDDKTVVATSSQFLAKVKQRRQVEVHGYAMDQNERDVRFVIRRGEQCAVQPLIVGGSETVDCGLKVHNIF